MKDSKENSSELELTTHEQETLMKHLDIVIPKELDDRLNARMTKMKSPKPFRKRWTKLFLTTAASLLLVFSLSMAISPTFASYVKSLFLEDDDLGLKEAFKNGYSKTVGKQVTDHGITVRINEVVADLNRISVSYEIVNENGEMLDTSLMKSSKDGPFYLTDSNGKEQYYGESGYPVWDRNFKPKGGIVTFDLQKVKGKRYIFHMDINNIGEKTSEDGTEIVHSGVNGNWKLQFPIDLTKGVNASKEINIDASLNWKNEIKLTIDRLVLSPSLSRLFYHVDQSEELMKQPVDSFGTQEVNLQYFITDEHNKKVVNNSETDTVYSEIQYPPFPKSKYYVFHLTGMSYATVTNESFLVTSKTLPVTKNIGLGKITIKRIKQVDGNTIITIEGIRPKDVQQYGWSIQDEQGQLEDLFSFESKNGKIHGEMQSFTEEIGIEGEPITDKLQLQLIAVKKYHPMNWSCKIE